MIDEDLLRLMASGASLDKNDVVLEIGAGLGFLTRLLSQKCKQVIAVEVDPRLMRILRTELQDLENVKLIRGDVLKVPIPSFNKVVSNLPFQISSPICNGRFPHQKAYQKVLEVLFHLMWRSHSTLLMGMYLPELF